MAENVKGLAMRYKHDGFVYELDSGKLVHTKGEQSIDGKKVFKTVPQVEGAPVEDNDVTNKKYVQDALDAFAAPKVASFTITATNSANAAQGAAPVEINKLKIFLADGRRLAPVFMEEGDLKGSTEAKLLVLTLNKQDQSDLTPTKVAKTKIESYALKDGEFLGKLYPCKFFGQHQDMYSNSDYQDPWNQYWTTADRFWNQENTTSGQVRIDIFDIDQMVQKLTFSSTSSGREAVFTATANDGAKEENGDVQKKENHVFDIVFPKMGEMLSKPGPVLLSTNQVVKDVKTFATPPKSANAPVANDDVANKAYVDNLNNELKGYVDSLIQKPGFDIELQIGVTALTSWNAFSQLNIILNNGKRLEAKYVENGVKSGSDPAKVVLVMTDNPDAEIPEPELKQASFFDTYELGSNEYACDFYNATAMGLGTIHSDPRQANPWRAYLVNGISSGQKGYYLKLVIKQLQDAISTVHFYCGDKHNGYGYPPKNFIFKASCNGVTTDEQVSKDNPSTKELIKFDIPADALPMGDNYVDLVSEQTISGVKTFAAVPKITAEPTEDTDAVNKKYIEEHFVSRPPKYDFKIEITCEGNSSYVAYSELKINLTGGKVIEPLYLEKREVRPDNNIYRFVYKISDASAVTVKQTPRKSSSEMDAYQLQDGEYIGHLYYAGHFSSATVMNAYDNQTDPWYGYLFQGGSGKLTMCQIILSGLPTDVTGIAFKSGDKHNSFIYKSAKYGAKFTYGNKSQEHELTNAQATHEFLVDAKALAPEAGNSGFVELNGDQSINGVKTFLTPPKSVKAPTDAKDIANKAYVDNRLGAGFDVTFTIKQAFSATWGGLSKLHVELAKGVLEAKYVEDVMPANAKEPALIVWTTKSAATKDPQVTYKSKEDIKGYELQDGEYLGDITYAELLGPYKSHTSTDYRCPFDTYLYNGGVLGQKPLIKVNIYSLKQAVKSVRYLNGYNGSSYVGSDHAVDFVVNNIESTSTLTGAGTSDDAPFVFTPTVKTLFDNEKSNYVPIKGNAIVFDKKTFTNKVFITDPDQASEMVTGQVATMESLKAVGLIGKALPDTQYICLWGDLREAKKSSAKDNKSATYEMSELELHTATGQLYLKYMEEVSVAAPNGTTPQPSGIGLCVLSRKKEWDNTTDLPVKNKAFLKSYALQPGEFLAKVRVINGAWRSGLSSGAQTGVAPYGSNGNFAGLFAARAKNNDYAKFSCYMQGVINAETVVNQTFRYAEIIIYNAPAIEKIKLTSARDNYYQVTNATGGINTINAFISTDEKFNSFDKITSYIGGVATEAADNSTKMYFDEGSKTAGYTTSPKSVEVPLTNYEEGTSQTESADAAYGYLQAVTISNDQDIAGNKTFIKPVTCTEPPVENGHLVNKKYVDDELAKLVARIAALEAAKP